MQKKSIYKYSAEAGVPVGLYLTAMSMCLLMSLKFPGLPILLLPLAIGFPFILWFQLKKIVKRDPSYNKFASLWLGGIYSVIFGTLICLLLSALYVRIFEPNFVWDYLSNAIATVESNPLPAEYSKSVEIIKEAMESHLVPSSFEFLTTMAWFTCFIGSLISLLIALVMSKQSKSYARQFQA